MESGDETLYILSAIDEFCQMPLPKVFRKVNGTSGRSEGLWEFLVTEKMCVFFFEEKIDSGQMKYTPEN